ncbi:uncharacterized protein [Coffea arabica]|uniref:DNA helicase Pif1-like 2B domain-containing protein n=1 Tax=Coffea arabica TaxID=13443 RepID=A0A6P6VJP9_COFAR|nr:ATP-dependent DNA helicase PIF1-like [Coffea arabica]
MHAHLDKPFSDFLLSLGNGTLPCFDDSRITLRHYLTIPFVDDQSSLSVLITSVFPDLIAFGTHSLHILNRAILTTKNEFVHEINNLLITKFPGTEHKYVSYDETIDQSKQAEHKDFLHSLEPPSLPPHELILKVNSPIVLLRNLNPKEGLCYGTRLICLGFAPNVIHALIAVRNHIEKQVFIPKISLQCSDSNIYIVPFKKTQLSVRLCFAMTINKAQGQTLDFVGLYLKEPVFGHGQLYVALSRAKTANDVRVLVKPSPDEQTDIVSTRNIVYNEVLSIAGVI